MRPLYGIYGAGGCGRGVMPLLRQQLLSRNAEIVFIDDGHVADTVNGQSVLTWERFTNQNNSEKFVAIAIASSTVREEIDLRRAKNSIELIDIIAQNVVLMDNVEIGEGAIISPFVTITSNIKIGRSFHCNISSYVEHDCIIGDFVTFAPGVRCNGNVHIDDYAYIGTGAIIRQGTPDNPLRIGKGAVIGMGAVVTKDVAPGVTVVGNPARLMQSKG